MKRKRDDSLTAKLREWLKNEMDRCEQKPILPEAPKEEFYWSLRVYRAVRKKFGELSQD